jgi:DNA mismatch repair protein MutS2
MMSDDAVLFVEKALDEAMTQGYGVVNVVHGLGTGALKKAIRAHLKLLPYVKSFGPAPAIEGGDGKTIIQL